MYWLRLKLELLPCIAQEVDRVSQEYLGMVEEARKGDKNSYQQLILLQIRARIEEFDKFYEKNYADFRIAYFEKLKLRLRKLLSTNIDVNVFIQEEQRNQIKKGGEEKVFSSKSPGMKKGDKVSSIHSPQGSKLGGSSLKKEPSNPPEKNPLAYGRPNTAANPANNKASIISNAAGNNNTASNVVRPSTAVATGPVTKLNAALKSTATTTPAKQSYTVKETLAMGKKPAPQTAQEQAIPSRNKNSTPSPNQRNKTPTKAAGSGKAESGQSNGGLSMSQKLSAGSAGMQSSQKGGNQNILSMSSPIKKATPQSQATPPNAKAEEEVMFTIRMTREEYMKFLEAKNKKK